MYDLTVNPSDTNDSVSMEMTLPQVGNVCDTTFSGCDFSQRFAEILEGPDVSNSVQAQSTNDYEKASDFDISSSNDEKPEVKSSFSMSSTATVKIKFCIKITCFNTYS